MKCLYSSAFICGLIISTPLSAATVKDCTTLHHHGKLNEAKTCFTSLLEAADPYTRAEGLWGLERYQDANDQFKLAAAAQPTNTNIRVRWGRLFLDRFNKAEAEKLFGEAINIDDQYAPAYLGLALKESDGFSPKATEYAAKALELD